VPTVDLTGGAPELAPCFRDIVTRARSLGRAVIVRTHLTVQQVAGFEELPEFFAAQSVRVVASLPCYLAENVDRQRGRGVHAASLAGLRRLNAVGYGRPGGLRWIWCTIRSDPAYRRLKRGSRRPTRSISRPSTG